MVVVAVVVDVGRCCWLLGLVVAGCSCCLVLVYDTQMATRVIPDDSQMTPDDTQMNPPDDSQMVP